MKFIITNCKYIMLAVVITSLVSMIVCLQEKINSSRIKLEQKDIMIENLQQKVDSLSHPTYKLQDIYSSLK